MSLFILQTIQKFGKAAGDALIKKRNEEEREKLKSKRRESIIKNDKIFTICE